MAPPTTKKVTPLEVFFRYEKDTKNKVRYQEEGDDDVIGKLYVDKVPWELQGKPKRLKVTLEGL